MAAGDTDTFPNCGSCGWKISDKFPNRDYDTYCDACGADLLRFGFDVVAPPVDLAADNSTPGQISFTWTPGPDESAFRYQINGSSWVSAGNVTPPWVVLGSADDIVGGQVATAKDGLTGPWSATAYGTIT